MLWVDEVDVCVDVVGGEDYVFVGDYFGVGVDGDVYFGLDVWVVGFVDGLDVFVFEIDVGFDYVLVVED